MRHAHCRTTAPLLFFAHDSETNSERERREVAAKEVCAACSVRAQCLDYAMRSELRYGIWGGLTESERATLRRKLRAPAG